MKATFFKHLGIVILLSSVWIGAHLYHARYADLECLKPRNCLIEEINFIDRPVVGMGSPHINKMARRSDVTQSASGIWAITSVIGMQLIFPHSGWIAGVGTRVLTLIEATLLNGAMNEVTRTIVQRPRPYVYQNPLKSGQKPQNYTSFYSGHTSFTAAMFFSLLFLFGGSVSGTLTPKQSRFKNIILTTSGFLCFATGVLRVLGGQHFITDVIFSVVAGFTAVWILFRLKRSWRF